MCLWDFWWWSEVGRCGRVAWVGKEVGDKGVEQAIVEDGKFCDCVQGD